MDAGYRAGHGRHDTDSTAEGPIRAGARFFAEGLGACRAAGSLVDRRPRLSELYNSTDVRSANRKAVSAGIPTSIFPVAAAPTAPAPAPAPAPMRAPLPPPA